MILAFSLPYNIITKLTRYIIMIDKKKISASKVRQFYKRFANGEQYIELGPLSAVTNDFEEVCKRY